MKDYSELKRLAQAAKRSGEENGERWPEEDDWFEPDLISDEMAFVKAVSPTNVLALIAELENLRGCDTAYAEVWEKARALQSEMDEVRQDAERYRWFRDDSTACDLENMADYYPEGVDLYIDEELAKRKK